MNKEEIIQAVRMSLESATTTEIQLYRSVVPENPDQLNVEDGKFKKAPGRTIVIQIDGGANNVIINHVRLEGEEAPDGGH